MGKMDLKMPFVYAQSVAMTGISSAYIGITSFSSTDVSHVALDLPNTYSKW